MVLFELLQLARVFLYYLRIEYLWHALIMPLTNRNGITSENVSSRNFSGCEWMTNPPGTLLGSVLVLLRQALPKRGEGEAHVGPHPGLSLGEEHHYHIL